MLNLRFFFFLASVLFICCLQTNAQQTAFRFLNFNSKDGLSSGYMYGVSQDARGYLWVGTGNGLYRYNGKRFESFRSTIDRPGSTISNGLQGVYADQSGNLWLGSINDFQWYNTNTDRYSRPNERDSVVKKLLGANIYNFQPDREGDIWIVTQNNFFFRFDKKDSSFNDYENLITPETGRTVFSIIQGRDERFYAILPNGVMIFRKNGSLIKFIPCLTAYLTNGVYHAGKILVSTFGNGILFLNEDKNELETWMDVGRFAGNSIFCLTSVSDTELWAGSYSLFHIVSGEVTEIKSSRLSTFDLHANKIGLLFFDRNRNLWISSHNGLSLMCWQNQSIVSAKLIDKNSTEQMEPNAVVPIGDKGDFLVAGFQTRGYFYYEASSGKLLFHVNPFTQKSITAIVVAPDGKIFCTDDERFYQFDGVSRALVPFVLRDESGKPMKLIGRNCYDKKGRIYIASADNGFYVWDYPGKTVKHYNLWDIDKSLPKGDNMIYPTLADRLGNIWFTSNSGVYELKVDENKFNHRANTEYPGIPLMRTTQSICEDAKGHIWISTLDNGIYELYFDKGEEQLKNFGQQSGVGLPSDYIYRIKPDSDDRFLWLATSQGVLRYDTELNKVVLSLTEQRGLFKDDTYSIYTLPNNIVVATYFGVLDIFDFSRWKQDKNEKVIQFNSIKVMNRELVYDGSYLDRRIEIDYDKNYVQLDFSSLNFNNPNHILYSWQLEGIDPNPVVSNSGTAIYSGLQPGKYRFKVKAGTGDNYWASEETELILVVRPPFWKRTWFFILIASMIGGLAYLFYRRKIDLVKQQAQLKEVYTKQMAELELKALRAQMNPHFIFNSLNSIQKYILQNETIKASQYLTRFSRLIRLILDHSDTEYIELSSEIELLKLYCEMENARFNGQFKYEIILDPEILPELCRIPSMMIQPYIENAIWHGLLHKEGMGNLTIKFKKEGEALRVEIDDDGVGRAKAEELRSKQSLKRKSYGIQVTQHRINVINRQENVKASVRIIDKVDESGKPTGTLVVLTIPLSPINTSDYVKSNRD